MGTFSKELQTVVSSKFDQFILEGIIRDLYKFKKVEIEDIVFQQGSKKGDSYLSNVTKFTIKAKGSDEKNIDQEVTLHAINKALLFNLGRRKTFRSPEFFKNEIIFYNTVWKAMRDFQLATSGSIFFDKIPLCISALADGSHDYVLLKDLTYEGYRAAERSSGLDLNHASLILKVFAQFHGVGLAFKDRQPEKFEEIASSLEETYFSENQRGWYTKFQTEILFEVVRDAVKKQLPNHYSEKLEQVLSGDFFGKLIQNCAIKDRLAVITHGDAWVPNFLMKYKNDNIPESAYMIDFQLARYASPALDVLFFLLACTDQDLRVNHWDHLIEIYHNSFVQTLKVFGSKPDLLTLEDLKTELKKFGIFGFGMSLEAISMSLLDDDDAVDLDMIQDDQGVPLESVWIVKPFKCKEKRQRVADIFRYLVDYGYL